MAEPITFEIAGKQYKAKRMNPFEQLKLTTKLAPVVAKVLSPDTLKQAIALMPKGEGSEGDLDGFLELVGNVIPSALQALSDMSEADLMGVVTKCLVTVQRQDGAMWAAIYSAGGLMYEDIDMLTMMAIVVRVIVGNVGGFTFASLSNLIPGISEAA